MGDVDVDIGANPSAEEADEGTESTSRKVVDVVDSFRLVVRATSRPADCTNAALHTLTHSMMLQEQSGHDKKSFMGYIKVCAGAGHVL